MHFFQRPIGIGRIGIIFSGLLVAACASIYVPEKNDAKSLPEARIVTEAENGGSIDLAVNQSLIVRLSSNRTTGYRWVLSDPADKVLKIDKPAGYEQNPEEKPVIGSGGIESWRFAAVAPGGRQTLRFEYRRPWEKGANAVPARVVSYTVSVR